jgi:hypothetical protein
LTQKKKKKKKKRERERKREGSCVSRIKGTIYRQSEAKGEGHFSKNNTDSVLGQMLQWEGDRKECPGPGGNAGPALRRSERGKILGWDKRTRVCRCDAGRKAGEAKKRRGVQEVRRMKEPKTN